MKGKLALVALCAALIVGADRGVGLVCRSTRLADQLVDIKHPAMLLAKLDDLRQFNGRKVVLLGDSLVYGGILEEFGDRQWREHNLAKAIERQCRERWPDEDVLVMNLGINGALPCDLEKLVPLVTACQVDCVMLDVHLRPFSSDFSETAVRMARPWLDEIVLDEQRRPQWNPRAADMTDVQPALSGWLLSCSDVFRYRHLLQESLAHSSLAKTMYTWHKPPKPLSENDEQIQALVKLGQLKNRLKNVTLAADNVQVAAFERMLSQLAASGQPYVVFYAKENPDLVYDVFGKQRHDELYARLTRMIQQAMRVSEFDHAAYLPPVDELSGEHFLDFTHLNVDGYQILARHLVEVLPDHASNGATIAQLE